MRNARDKLAGGFSSLVNGPIAKVGRDELAPAVAIFIDDVFRCLKAGIVAKFVGNTARFSILAYGGFTVGAWIPSRQLQLELDLSEPPGAPQVIREL